MSNELSCTCPICKDIMLQPLLYQCGHTICEPCMIKNDQLNIQNNNSVFNAVVYKCPLCRDKTHLSWQHRPVNRIVLDILRKNADYNNAYNNYKIQFIVNKPFNLKLNSFKNIEK